MQNARSPIELSWQTIEKMTSSMHVAANEKNWSAVLDQAAERHATLLQHFANYPVGPENSDFYRTSLSKMLNGEKSLDILIRDARKSLMAEGVVMNHNHRAVGAYLSSAR